VSTLLFLPVRVRPRSHAATLPPPRLVQTGSALPFTSNSTSTSTSPTPEEGKEATIPHRLLSSSFHFSFTTLLLCFSLPLPIVFRFLPPTCLRTSSFHRLGSGGPNFPRLKLAPNLASTTSCLALPATARNQPPTHETTAVDRRERKKTESDITTLCDGVRYSHAQHSQLLSAHYCDTLHTALSLLFLTFGGP
jgi:hypothetical protein